MFDPSNFENHPTIDETIKRNPGKIKTQTPKSLDINQVSELKATYAFTNGNEEKKRTRRRDLQKQD